MRVRACVCNCSEQFQEEGWVVRKEGGAGAVRLTLTCAEQAWCGAPGPGGAVVNWSTGIPNGTRGCDACGQMDTTAAEVPRACRSGLVCKLSQISEFLGPT